MEPPQGKRRPGQYRTLMELKDKYGPYGLTRDAVEFCCKTALACSVPVYMLTFEQFERVEEYIKDWMVSCH